MFNQDRARELFQRADTIVVNDLLTGGGLLLPAQYERFLEYVTDQPTILKDVRRVSMSREKMEFDKMGFGSRVLKSPWNKTPSVTTGVPHHVPSKYGPANTAGPLTNPMGELYALQQSDWAKPTLGRLWIEVVKKMAEIHLSYDTLENNIERADFSDHIMRLLAARVSVDIEEWILNASTTSTDTFLNDAEGVMKQANSTGHVTDALGATITTPLWFAGKRSIPPKYFRDGRYKIYTSPGVELDWREVLTNRPTSVGDQFLFEDGVAKILGMPLIGCANILEADTYVPGGEAPNVTNCTKALLIDPRNIMFGIFREILIETDKDIRNQEYIIVVSMKIGVQIDEPDAIGLIKNIKPRS